MRSIFKNLNLAELFLILVLIFLTLPAILPLIRPYFFSSHDGVVHVVRFAHFQQAIVDGQVIPRWIKGVAFGAGSPVLMYYGQLAYFASLIPRLLGATYSYSIQIMFAISLATSAVCFYFFSKDLFGKIPGFVGALMYVYAPYRFLDIYVRGAYPESFSFIFPPILFLSGRKLVERYSRFWFVINVISIAGLILSHNVMALLFLSVYFLYVLIFSRLNSKVVNLKWVFLGLVFGLTIAGFFWIPAYFEKNEVNLDKLNSDASYITNFVPTNKLIYSKWGWGSLDSDSPMAPQIGIVQQLVVCLSILLCLLMLIYKRTKLNFLNYFKKISFNDLSHSKTFFCLTFFLLVFFISLFLITPYSMFFWKSINLLSFVLYPWRFLSLVVFSSAVVGSFLVYALGGNKILIVILILMLIYVNRNFSHIVGKVLENDSFYQNYSNTTDIWGEFLPKSTDLNFIKKCKEVVCTIPKVSLSPSGYQLITEDKSNLLSADINVLKKTTVDIGIWKFPGWEIYLDGSVVSSTLSKLGTMEVVIPQGRYHLVAKFSETVFRETTDLISIFGFLILAMFVWRKKLT